MNHFPLLKNWLQFIRKYFFFNFDPGLLKLFTFKAANHLFNQLFFKI